MPWQRLVADIGGELLDDGRPAYRQVVFTVPRQCGKTTLVLGWEMQRALGWEHLGPQKILYSAQNAKSARKKLLEDQMPVLKKHRGPLGIQQFVVANGNESVVWRNGSRLSLMAGTEDAGHGDTIDLGVKDELWKDQDDRRDQALGPAMITRRFAQMLATSTMGTDDSIPWNRLVELGRRSAESDRRQGIAYFEWSASNDADPDDPATWWACMPSMGSTIEEEFVLLERENKPDNEFRRAYLNQQTKADDRVIPATLWNAVCDPNVVAQGRVVFAIDATPERTSGSLVACSLGELPVVEVVEHRRGNPAWLVDRAAELSERNGGAAVAVELRGPAGSLVAGLEKRGVPVVPASSAELVMASGQFYDAIVESTLRVRREPVLDAAVSAAVRRAVGDSWAWGRRSAQEDVTPLIAASLALWLAQHGGPSVYEERGMVSL